MYDPNMRMQRQLHFYSLLMLKYKMILLYLSAPNFCWVISSSTGKE